MMTKRNDKRTILRISIAAAVLLFLAAVLFVGAGAAEPFSWTITMENESTPSFVSGGSYEVTCSADTLGNYKDVTISGEVTLDFKGKSYKVETSADTSHGNRGGLFGQIILSGSGAKLTIRNLNVASGSVSGSFFVGGLVGRAYSAESRTLVFENCSISDVTFNAGGVVGGLVGCADSASCQYTNCMVANCYIASSVSSTVGGLVGGADTASSSISLKDCTVADCVIYGETGRCGGIIGYDACDFDKERLFTGNTVRNCLIYSGNSAPDAVGGIIGQADKSTGQTCSSNTVEYCTIVDGTNGGAGGIAGSFPAAGTLSGNKVFNTCVVSKGGAVAGICPVALS